MIFAAFISAFVASVGASLIVRGLMHDNGWLVAIGATILAVQALALFLMWEMS